VLIDRMSLRIPRIASQSASTDQFDPSPGWRLRFCHMRLRPSATGFSMPGRCRMSMMLWAKIDSFHRLWCKLIFSLRRQSA
jgi:hypothetical protein